MKKTLTFTLFILFIEIIITEKQEKIFKCGVGHYKMDPPIPGDEIPINYSSPFYRRRLQDIDNDGYKKFNIYLDFENLKEEIKIYKLEKNSDSLINCLKKAANILMSLLKVKPLSYNYWIRNYKLTDNQIYYWEKEKFGDEAYKKNKTLLSLGIDLVIFSRFENFGAVSNSSTLASARAFLYDIESYKPIGGIMNINPVIDFSKKGIEEYLISIFVHEFTHILGFSSYFFEKFKFFFSKIDKFGINRLYLNSTKVIRVAKKYFNCSDIDGIELENDGSTGTIGSHWE